MKSLRTPGYEVELAVSPLGGLKGAAGWHTSVLVSGEEFYFSPIGITSSPIITSHKKNPQMRRIPMGISKYSGGEMVEFLEQFFPPGHYDLLHKNCNAFTDAAIYFLCDQRLDWTFRTLEKFGKMADDRAGFIQSISGGEYAPNPRAVGFDLEAVIQDIEAARETTDGGSMRHEIEFSDATVDKECDTRMVGGDGLPKTSVESFVARDCTWPYNTPAGVDHFDKRAWTDGLPPRDEPAEPSHWMPAAAVRSREAPMPNASGNTSMSAWSPHNGAQAGPPRSAIREPARRSDHITDSLGERAAARWVQTWQNGPPTDGFRQPDLLGVTHDAPRWGQSR